MKKLSHRLSQLKHSVITAHETEPYQHIWDICCDHGYLGMALLQQGINSHIHFVDNVPHIIEEVASKLKKYSHQLEENNNNIPKHGSVQQSWDTICADAHSLNLLTHSNDCSEKHLVIIAGVGGDLTAALVTAMLANLNGKPLAIDFLLCPVHRNYELRQCLKQSALTLKYEQIINENNRFYESVLVTTKQGYDEVSLYGSKLWCYENDAEKTIVNNYFEQRLTHYHKVMKGFEKQLKYADVEYTAMIIAGIKLQYAKASN